MSQRESPFLEHPRPVERDCDRVGIAFRRPADHEEALAIRRNVRGPGCQGHLLGRMIIADPRPVRALAYFGSPACQLSTRTSGGGGASDARTMIRNRPSGATSYLNGAKARKMT